MKNNLVALRYARAVLKNVESSRHGKLNEDVVCLRKTFAENREYAVSLNSLLYPRQERLKLAETIAQKLNESEIWSSLFKILITKHRFDMITGIIDSLELFILAEQNEVKATLTLAYEHDSAMIDKIIRKVENEINRKIKATVIIDPAIIGGFVAETEDLRIDGTVKKNLIKLVKSGSKKF